MSIMINIVSGYCSFLYFFYLISFFLGIIIDQFGEGREELKKYNDDLKYICFVCGNSNEDIEKNSDQNQDFKSHIKVILHFF